MNSPRWWEPRFEGSVTRDPLPPAVFEGLAEQARGTGLCVIEEPPGEARPSYRASAAPSRSLRLEQREAFVGAWDRLRIWQEGPTRIRFEGSFRRWANHLRLVWVVFALLYGGILSFCCPMALAVCIGATLALTFLPIQWVHRHRTTRWVEHFVGDEVKRAEAWRAAPDDTADAVHRSVAPPTRAEVPIRVRAVDPVLVAAARTAHDAVIPDRRRSPEDEVLALEEASKRR